MYNKIMRYKLLIFGLIFIFTVGVNGVFAQTTAISSETAKPGLLPTSPFYFLKEFNRNVVSFFTFNPVSKAKLELKFADERAAEIKALEETKKGEGVEKAVGNYQQNVERLQTRLQALTENSNNPNVDKLLDELTQRAVVHQELFDEIKAKHSEIKEKIEAAQEAISTSLSTGLEKLDLPEKIEARFEKTLEKIEQPFGEIRSLNVLSQIEGKIVKEEIKNKLLKVEEKLISKFEGKVEAGEISLPDLPQLIKNLPEATETKLKILDTVRENISDNSLKTQINVIRQGLFDEVKNTSAVSEEKAKNEIENAARIINEFQETANKAANATDNAVRQLIDQAKFNFEQASRSFEADDFGRAFGQAVSAQAIAKNAIRKLTGSIEDTREEIDDFKKEFDALKAGAKKKGLTPENAPQLYEFFKQAESKIVQTMGLVNKESAKATLDVLVKEVRKVLSSITVLIQEGEIKKELKGLEESFQGLDVKGAASRNEWKVEITNGRFNPPTLKIKKGDTVTWINTDGSAGWPASAGKNVFDASRSLGKGESWSFTFNETGTWKYQNQSLAGATGVIEVGE